MDSKWSIDLVWHNYNVPFLPEHQNIKENFFAG